MHPTASLLYCMKLLHCWVRRKGHFEQELSELEKM